MEVLRSRMLIAVSRKSISNGLGLCYIPTRAEVGRKNDGVLPLKDFMGLRQFVSGNGVITLFDAPWMPFI